MSNQTIITINEEDAFHFIVRIMREGEQSGYASYGYGLYLPNVMREYLRIVVAVPHNEIERYVRAISPPFYNAAWDLCRRGILRPGIRMHGEQVTQDGSGGNGYSITPFGKQWLEESDKDDYIPTEPGRFAKMLETVGSNFGNGFRQRSQEAIRCYGAHAYFACCAMCGAATESIIISTAVEKTNDEERILRDYSTAGGRGKIENLIIGQKPNSVQNEFRAYSSLLKYWRDNATHGKALDISDNEAYTSLALLLRLSMFVHDHWKELTS